MLSELGIRVSIFYLSPTPYFRERNTNKFHVKLEVPATSEVGINVTYEELLNRDSDVFAYRLFLWPGQVRKNGLAY